MDKPEYIDKLPANLKAGKKYLIDSKLINQDTETNLDDFIDNMIAPFSIHRARYARPHGTVARRQFKNRMKKRLQPLIDKEVTKARIATLRSLPDVRLGGDDTQWFETYLWEEIDKLEAELKLKDNQ
jgi:hypothetical protein